ncbi:hypothetical protein C923_01283 [Plasmodium falciparum UGT5.1]|uniref:Uncharacterized protein n=1 Tax=Plasmodium falciparum UGT5.1 TaxID=1237627 RepID=W7JG85_PLAFA|nr:hypothetical protein C923_01283 [Plasmodium falciparum UGT5.1]
MKDNFKEDDDSTLDTSNNVMLERTNNHPKVERSFRLQNNKNKFVRLLPVFFIFIVLLGIYLIYIMNKNVEEKKKNMTDEESNVISMSEGKDSNDDKKKKKKVSY